jgi:ketosteroid isomerase-like protein
LTTYATMDVCPYLPFMTKEENKMANSDSVDIAAIKSLTEQLTEAYGAHDWDGFTSFFTDDAVWMPPDQPPLIGKDAWWSWIGGGWDQSTLQQHTTNHKEIVIAGDWAFEWHTETQVGEGWQHNSKGIWILQRQNDGSWKIARYCFNGSPVADNQTLSTSGAA